MEIEYSVYSSSCVWAFTARLLGDFVKQSLKIVKRFYFVLIHRLCPFKQF